MAIFEEEQAITLDTVEPVTQETEPGAVTPTGSVAQETPTYQPGVTQQAEGYQTPSVYDPGTTGTVAGQMEGILAKESPYLQAARERGEQYAHSRGLLSSSMAAGAAEKAAIEAALPIAQQDAATYSKAGLQQQAFEESAGLVDIKAGASSQLAEQEAFHARELENIQQHGANYRQQQEIALKERLSAADVSLAEKGALADSLTALGDNFQAKLAGIQVDPNLNASAKTDAIQTLQEAYEANLQSLGSIYGVEITWDLAGGTGTGGGTEDAALQGVESTPQTQATQGVPRDPNIDETLGPYDPANPAMAGGGGGVGGASAY